MKDADMTMEHPTSELTALRTRVAELEAADGRRRRAEEALHLSDRILEQMPDAILFMDGEGTIRRWTGKAERIFGYPADEAIGRPFHFLFRPDIRERTTADFIDAVQMADEFFGEVPCLRKDGSEAPVEMTASKICDRNGRSVGLVGIGKDLTGRKRQRKALGRYQNALEQQAEKRTAALKAANERLQVEIAERRQMEQGLVRLERLRALGEMSAGVSHNLNNILTGVLGPAQILKQIADDPRVLREAEEIIASAMRARDLVHRLHLSVRGVADETLRPVQVDETVREAVRAARPRWKDEAEAGGVSIDVVAELEDSPPIMGTRSGLHDIVINLLFNAVDAMPEGGTITIGTRAVSGGVRLVVTDTGVGMDEETRKRIFEPFFTTKRDVGTGLGLSTVYGTVTRWGGEMDVTSAPGRGTTFALRLPIWPESETAPPEEGRGIRPTRRHGRILIVEDDEGICSLLSRLLEKHEVETVRSGREALKTYAPGRYDVVLIDLEMPGMPGDRVVREMAASDPALATGMITGWEQEEIDPDLSPFDFRLQKPFRDIAAVGDVVAQAVALHDARAGRQG